MFDNMKCAFFLILFTFSCLNLYSQDKYKIMHSDNGKSININDTSFVRILNGIVVSNKEKISGFEGVKILSKEDSKELGFSGNSSVMIISKKVPNIESQIDSVFKARFHYKLPISLRY